MQGQGQGKGQGLTSLVLRAEKQLTAATVDTASRPVTCACYCRSLKDVGVGSGFVGCIDSLQINSSQTSVSFDLSDDSSHNVLHKVNIGQ